MANLDLAAPGRILPNPEIFILFRGPAGPAATSCGNRPVRRANHQLPVLSGYELIRRAHHRGHRVPMIAVTVFDTPEHRLQVFLHGFAYHLIKPFDPEHLVTVVGETVRTEAMRQHSGVRRPNSEAE
ncbi:MAG: response regulator [Vicinamibacterales bacterium]